MVKNFIEKFGVKFVSWLGQVLNLGVHGWMIYQLSDPARLIRESVEAIDETIKMSLEDSLRAPGLFEFMVSMPELPPQIFLIFKVSQGLAVVSWLIAAKAFWDLLTAKKWAYGYIWSIVLVTGGFGVLALDLPSVIYGILTGYILYQKREFFNQGEKDGISKSSSDI